MCNRKQSATTLSYSDPSPREAGIYSKSGSPGRKEGEGKEEWLQGKSLTRCRPGSQILSDCTGEKLRDRTPGTKPTAR